MKQMTWIENEGKCMKDAFHWQRPSDEWTIEPSEQFSESQIYVSVSRNISIIRKHIYSPKRNLWIEFQFEIWEILYLGKVKWIKQKLIKRQITIEIWVESRNAQLGDLTKYKKTKFLRNEVIQHYNVGNFLSLNIFGIARRKFLNI